MPSSFLVDPLIPCCVVVAQDDLVSIDEGRGRSCSRSAKRCDVDPACLGLIALLLRRVPALRLSSSHDDGTLVLCHVMEHEGWMCRESGFPMERDTSKVQGSTIFVVVGPTWSLGGVHNPRPRAGARYWVLTKRSDKGGIPQCARNDRGDATVRRTVLPVLGGIGPLANRRWRMSNNFE